MLQADPVLICIGGDIDRSAYASADDDADIDKSHV